jgi:hypothetical protein
MPIGPLLFDGSICTAADAARLSWCVSAFWSLDWTPPVPPHPHDDPLCVWVADCGVVAVLPEVAEEAALFVCVSEPAAGARGATGAGAHPQDDPSGAPPIEIGSETLPNPDPPQPHSDRPGSCSAFEAARLSWLVSAFWVLDWTPPVPLQPHEDPLCVWVADCGVVAVLPEVAEEAALLVWLTLPLLPGLNTRTETLLLLGATWVASDSAAECWSVSACWLDDCTPEPPCVWLAVCGVVAVLPEVADEAALFVCDTFPSLPGLKIRTETFSFDGSACVAEDAAPDACSVDASWADDCTAGADDAAGCESGAAAARTAAGSPLCAACASPVGGVAQPHEGDCVWVADCGVVAVLPDVADEAALFDCVTVPSEPGLRTRTTRLSFVGWTWTASEAASAAWSVVADCVDDSTGGPANADPTPAAAATSVTASVAITRLIESSFCVISGGTARTRAAGEVPTRVNRVESRCRRCESSAAAVAGARRRRARRARA